MSLLAPFSSATYKAWPREISESNHFAGGPIHIFDFARYLVEADDIFDVFLLAGLVQPINDTQMKLKLKNYFLIVLYLTHEQYQR